jgi:hypothetical protein
MQKQWRPAEYKTSLECGAPAPLWYSAVLAMSRDSKAAEGCPIQKLPWRAVPPHRFGTPRGVSDSKAAEGRRTPKQHDTQ